MRVPTFAEFANIVGFDLAAEQQAVVTAPALPQRVAAGAGTGKTTSMALRVAWLVASEQVAADAVLGLTFTTKAAASLHSTVRGLLRRWHEGWEGWPGDELAEPLVMTYHAFAARIIAEHGVRLGYEPNGLVLVNGARHRLAYEVVCRASAPALARAGRSPITVTGQVLHLDDQLTDLAVAPESLIEREDREIEWLRSLAKRQGIVERMLETCEERRALAELVMGFRAAKRARDAIDFADQTRLAGDLVRRCPAIVDQWRGEVSLVLLDEYQDTSIAQRKLIQEVFGKGRPITAVGDVSQAIYGWRGASVANMEAFHAHFEAPETPQSLNLSYRSGRALLAVANAVSEPIEGRSGRLEPGNPLRGDGHVTCGLFETRHDEHAWIGGRIGAMGVGVAAVPWGDIAVLAATGAELVGIEQVLNGLGIPTQVHGAAGLLRQPAVVDLRSMLEVIHDPTANRAVIRLLAGPRWRLGPRDLAALGRRAAELVGGDGRGATSSVAASLDAAVVGSDPAEALSLLEAALHPGDAAAFSPEGRERLADFAAMVRTLSLHASEPVPDLIGRVVERSGLAVEILLSRDGDRHRTSIAGLMDLAADFTRVDDGGTLGAFLARLADAERFDVDLPIDGGRRSDAVQLMTIHKAKGLEFPHVFVPSMSEGAFPSGHARQPWTTDPSEIPYDLREDMRCLEDMPVFPDPELGPRATDHDAYRAWLKGREFLEARRLAYVALTRAQCTLSVTGHWWGPTQQSPRGPSPFLLEVRDTIVGLPDSWWEIPSWEPAPADGAKNPAVDDASGDGRAVAWPAPLHEASRVQAGAARVRAHLDRLSPTSPELLPSAPSRSEGDRIARWDADLAFLVAEARDRTSGTRVIRLPESVSASTMMRAQADPAGLAADLARPMPRPPSPAARRGTAFHTWVEQRFGQATLIDIDDLPGAVDAQRIDVSLADLQDAFEHSPYAALEPVATEFPFGILMNGRIVRGRIDAVFTGHPSLVSPGERVTAYEVVDWKTGRGRGLDPMQLAIYRLAWARHVGLPEDRIGAAFLVVETREIIRPEVPLLGG